MYVQQQIFFAHTSISLKLYLHRTFIFKVFFSCLHQWICLFWNQNIVTYYELIKQKLLQTNPKVISSKYDSCKFPAFRNASKVQHASLGAGSWCRLLEEVKECAAQKGNFFDCTDHSCMLQLHAGEDRHFTCTSHLTEIVKEQKYLQSPWKL
jgi:hypothetical protein